PSQPAGEVAGRGCAGADRRAALRRHRRRPPHLRVRGEVTHLSRGTDTTQETRTPRHNSMTKMNMKSKLTDIDVQTINLLKEYVHPIAPAAAERDLWPLMSRRLDQRSAFSLTRLQLALLAAVLVMMVLWPRSIAALFYQL